MADLFREEIITLLKKSLNLDREVILEVPPSPELGDYAFPCFPLAKIMKKSPQEIAQDLSKQLKPSPLIERIEAHGPYVNFFLDQHTQAIDTLQHILKEKENYGRKKSLKKKVVIEFVGPNTNKPLHLGHVRNMVLGVALGNILEVGGCTVVPVNINNDRGVHICKSMLAYKKWGNDDSPEKSGLKSDHFVGKYYVKFAQEAKNNPELEQEVQAMLAQWEAHDPTVIALWKNMNTWALAGFQETYALFGVRFAKEYYESETYLHGKEIVLEGLQKGIFSQEADGAIVVDLHSQGYGKKVLLRSNGTAVYITQDLYVAKLRYEDYHYDQCIYVVANEQNHHFQVLFTVLRLLGMPFADKCYHFSYGMVNLPTGKMKSREGTVVDADDLVAEMVTLAKQETVKRHPRLSATDIEARAQQIAMAAIRFYLLKHDPSKDILFHPEESLAFEGETGPYVQYAHARICSILRKARFTATPEILKEISFAEQLPQEKELIALLARYPGIVEDTISTYRLSLIPRYLLDLAQQCNEFYHSCPILKAPPGIKLRRLMIIAAVRQVLQNGLTLLAIDAPERM
ncbi:arginine--tRNA ligase [Candidatus Woesearchaeota archaeon]|nr:arginine--tRNA ligase [Candidatus Woesearchaeota archaeon]